jgi:uncharacterized OB-fold protein
MTNVNELPAIPLPEPTLESAPYWDALREHRLVFQQCGQCNHVRHYPRPVCPQCFSMDVTWKAATGNGTVHSWTVCHHAFHPGFKRQLPYIVLTVDMEEGVRMVGQVDNIPESALCLGLPVQVTYADVNDNITLPVFQARTQG